MKAIVILFLAAFALNAEGQRWSRPLGRRPQGGRGPFGGVRPFGGGRPPWAMGPPGGRVPQGGSWMGRRPAFVESWKMRQCGISEEDAPAVKSACGQELFSRDNCTSCANNRSQICCPSASTNNECQFVCKEKRPCPWGPPGRVLRDCKIPFGQWGALAKCEDVDRSESCATCEDSETEVCCPSLNEANECQFTCKGRSSRPPFRRRPPGLEDCGIQRDQWREMAKCRRVVNRKSCSSTCDLSTQICCPSLTETGECQIDCKTSPTRGEEEDRTEDGPPIP